ncbi:MAG: wax ester/triacylglycerol synthase family O-acyltransferase [Halioglobus sp.]
MEKLSFQDAAFLRLDSTQHPYHVAGLMIFRLPPRAPKSYLRKLARNCAALNEIWPIFNKKLHDPYGKSTLAWVPEDNYDSTNHVFHYALPAPGNMEDLLTLVSRAHEKQLDRSRPLWEMHLIEGLRGGRFALFCKVHHALVDGVGALKMIDAMFTTSPDQRMNFARAEPLARVHHEHRSLVQKMTGLSKGVLQQYRALPQLSSLLTHMGTDALLHKKDAVALPFTGPRTLFNTEVDSRRRGIICDLPLGPVRKIGRLTGGTLNDVLLAICGGALREYLKQQKSLPSKTLISGLPVSVRSEGATEGNQLSFILCPFYTDERDPLKRLKRIIKVTRKAKAEVARVSATASQDFANMMLMPTILLTLSGNTDRVNPAINAIFSNVPGSREQLYLDRAPLEGLYPFSVVTDGMGINLTVISYMNKLCFAITSCPTRQPGIENLGNLLKQSYRDLQSATKAR